MGKLLFNIFALPLMYLIAWLPFSVISAISYGMYLLVFYVTGYRKKVVYENLRRSFPEKNELEIRVIAKQFYLHFCDTIFETIKVLTISKENFKAHCYFTPKATALFHRFENEKKGFICVLGHCGNWEWTSIGHQVYFNVLLTGIYHPLSNPSADKLILKLRTRFGGNMVPMKNTFREILDQRKKGIVSNLGLISDQTPPPESAIWITFLNQDTPVFSGTEKIAKKFGYPVIFISMKKEKRHHYAIDGDLLTDKAASLPDGLITEMHTRMLEQKIREQPYTWLWSHRRWKHKRPANI